MAEGKLVVALGVNKTGCTSTEDKRQRQTLEMRPTGIGGIWFKRIAQDSREQH